MDPLALQELQDCHTQQQPELLQCRYPYHPQHILRFYQLFQFAWSRDITEILHSFRRTLCELKQQRLEAEKQLTQKKLQLKQQEAQDNERSSVDHGAMLEALERALKATEAAFSEMADR